MDHQKFALRILGVMFLLALVGFTLEAAWDFSHALDPVTGKPLQWSQLHLTPNMVRAVASPFARAYNNILALLLTFISIAIPITANLYTPKLIEIFVRDRINLFVLCTCALLAAHSLFAITLSFDNWVGQLSFWIDCACAIIGWLLLMPYYFYVLSFLDPLTIIKRVHRGLTEEIESAVAGKYSVKVSQQRVNQKITNLGSVLLRAVDRADRDVSFDAIKTHMLELSRVRDVKPRLPAAFFKVNSSLLVGLSSDATDMLSEGRIWMEQQIASQLILAYKTVLGKMPDGVSAIAHAVKNAAYEEARLNNEAAYRLLVRLLNTFVREAIKKKDNASVANVLYNYKTLVRRLLADQPGRVPELVGYLRFYAEFSRQKELPFIYELISYEFCELTEVAFVHCWPPADVLLEAVLSMDGVTRSPGLIKSRVILAGYFLDAGLNEECAMIEASLREVPRAMLEAARQVLLNTRDRIFWEVTDRGANLDYVEDGRRERVREFFDRMLVSEG